MRTSLAVLRLAQDDPQRGDSCARAGSGRFPRYFLAGAGWLRRVFLLEAIARDALGDSDAAGQRPGARPRPGRTRRRAVCFPAVSGAGPARTARPAAYRSPALIADILSLLAGRKLAPSAGPPPPLEPLSESEIRVLRYLPTNLTGPEIAGELYVSLNTVRTHLRHLYAKLGTHRRAEAVARARALGLLAPSSYRGHDTRAG